MPAEGHAVGKPRIAVVEDDLHVRRGLRRRFGHVLDLVFFPTIREYEALEQQAWDGMIVDRSLPDGDGLELARRLRERDAGISIVLYTATDPSAGLRLAAASGVFFAPKPEGVEVLKQVAALWIERHSAQQGGEAIAARIVALAALYGLTDREEEVVRLAQEGLSREDASEKMHISADTHRTHVTNILTKTGHANLRELVAAISRQNASRKSSTT